MVGLGGTVGSALTGDPVSSPGPVENISPKLTTFYFKLIYNIRYLAMWLSNKGSRVQHPAHPIVEDYCKVSMNVRAGKASQ